MDRRPVDGELVERELLEGELLEGEPKEDWSLRGCLLSRCPFVEEVLMDLSLMEGCP